MYKLKMDFVWKPSLETVLLCISTFSALNINMNLWSEHQHGHRKNLVTAPQHKRGALFGDIVVDVGNSKRVKEGGTNSSDEVSEGGTDTVPVFLSRLWSIIILMIIMQWCWWFSPNEYSYHSCPVSPASYTLCVTNPHYHDHHYDIETSNSSQILSWSSSNIMLIQIHLHHLTILFFHDFSAQMLLLLCWGSRWRCWSRFWAGRWGYGWG